MRRVPIVMPRVAAPVRLVVLHVDTWYRASWPGGGPAVAVEQGRGRHLEAPRGRHPSVIDVSDEMDQGERDHRGHGYHHPLNRSPFNCV